MRRAINLKKNNDIVKNIRNFSFRNRKNCLFDKNQKSNSPGINWNKTKKVILLKE